MDETGFEQAYRTYAAHVYGRCMRLLRQREAARDVTLASGAQVPIEEARFTATAPELALAKGRRDRPGHELMLDAGLASLGPGFFAGSFEGGRLVLARVGLDPRHPSQSRASRGHHQNRGDARASGDGAGLVVATYGLAVSSRTEPLTYALEVWNASTGQVESSIVLPGILVMSDLQVSRNGQYYLTVSNVVLNGPDAKGLVETADYVQLYRRDGTLVRSHEVQPEDGPVNFVTSLSISADSTSYAVVDAYGALTVYSIANGSVVGRLVPDPIEK